MGFGTIIRTMRMVLSKMVVMMMMMMMMVVVVAVSYTHLTLPTRR